MSTSAATPPPASPVPGVAPARRGLRQRLTGLAKIALSVALLAWLASRGAIDGDALRRAVTDPGAVALALLLGGVGISMSGVRWYLLLKNEGIDISLGHAVQLTWIGHFWNMVFPGAVSGDAVKMYYVGHAVPHRREEAWTTVVADRVIGLMALVSLAAVASLTSLDRIMAEPLLKGTFLTIVAILAGFATVCLAFALGLGRGSARIRPYVDRLPFANGLRRAYDVLGRLARRPAALGLSFGISFLAHMLAVLNGWCLGRAAVPDFALSLVGFGAVFPVALFANAVPITPGGVGIGETVLKLLFASSGATAHDGVTVMLLYRGQFYALAFLGALLYVSYKRVHPSGPEVAPAPAAGPPPDAPSA